MKPILEWYEQLPEPIRSQAIENYDSYFKYAKSLYESIVFGFKCSKTEQGRDYWIDIRNRAKKGEFDDPIEKLKQLITKLEERQEQFEKLL